MEGFSVAWPGHHASVKIYPSSGEGIEFDHQQVLGRYVRRAVGAYEPTHHFWVA